MKNYNKSEIFKRAHWLFRTCKSLYKTFVQALSDAWKSAIKKVSIARNRDKELKNYIEYPKAIAMTQQNLSEYYNVKPGT